MKIIIYGLGSGCARVEKYLKKEHTIIGYSDSFFKEKSFKNKKFYKPEELVNAECDFIIIAIGEEKNYRKIQDDLMNYGIKNIVSFYEIYNDRYHIRRIKKIDEVICDNKKLEGLILGISHAEIGINPKYLDKSFYNLAISYQDLFYNLEQLKYLVKNYKEKTSDLEYIILDMYDYTYFNYDISRSKGAINFYKLSGFSDNQSHNYKYNSNFEKSIEEEIQSEKSEELEVFSSLFSIKDFEMHKNDINYFVGDYPQEKLISSSIKDSDIEKYKNEYIRLSNIQRNVYVDTENDNIEIFEQILDILFGINKKMKIYLVLIPQYVEVENRLKVAENYWKIRFYSILSNFRKKYDFQVLDFKDSEEIRSKKEYYIDLKHLNFKGAVAFTKLLNSYIAYE